MKNNVESINTAPFGFGHYRNYCAKFAQKTMLVGGADMKYYDVKSLINQTNSFVMNKGIVGVSVAIKLIEQGPTGENIIHDIESNYNQGSRAIKFK